MCALLAMNGSRSKTCNTLTLICNKLNVDKFSLLLYNLHINAKLKQKESVDSTLVRKAMFIRDLLLYRETLSGIDFSNVNTILEHLCLSD